MRKNEYPKDWLFKIDLNLSLSILKSLLDNITSLLLNKLYQDGRLRVFTVSAVWIAALEVGQKSLDLLKKIVQLENSHV
jgi:hypothetical protein